MNIAEVFERLLDNRKVSMALVSKADAASPRVSLLRKFKDYKTQMLALGFLDPTLETSTVSLEWDEETKIATFFLREKKSQAVEYTIVEIPELETTNGA